jgi:hypothetical protein
MLPLVYVNEPIPSRDAIMCWISLVILGIVIPLCLPGAPSAVCNNSSSLLFIGSNAATRTLANLDLGSRIFLGDTWILW